jgi:citrate synthase
VAEAHELFARLDLPAQLLLRARGIGDLEHHVERRARRAAMQRALQRAKRADHRRHEVRPRRRDHARGKRGGIQPVIDDGVQVCLEPAHAFRVGRLAVQHVEEIRGMPQVGSWGHHLLAALDSPVRRHDRGRLRDDRRRLVGGERDCARGRPQGVHRVQPRAGAFAKQRQRGLRQGALGGKLGAKGRTFVCRRQIAVPQQPGGFLERRVRRELADRIPGDNQLSPFAIDVTEARRRRDHPFETAVDRRHGDTVVPVYDAVNVDSRINMSADHPWVSAADASRLLRVSRATLYAYVSRGYIRSQATPGPSRERRYSRDDVERVRRRSEERRNPETAAARALHWGVPVLESSITFIDGARVYYRGHDAVDLARTRSVAAVASLIWRGHFDETFPSEIPQIDIATSRKALPFVARAQALLGHAALHDHRACDFRPLSVAATGWRILHLLTTAATMSQKSGPAIEQALGRAWDVAARGHDVLRSALILCADHELNVSSFTARCVASAGSHPYAVTIAGLAALEGTRHGGSSARVESMLATMRRARPVKGALAARLRRGEPIDGFGHPLYRGGDPRAKALLDVLRDGYRRSPEYAFVTAVADAAASATGELPNLDFALAAVARVLRLPTGSALTLFAIGRTIGWIGHAIEQYGTGQLIRPRAKYVGPVPGAAQADSTAGS